MTKCKYKDEHGCRCQRDALYGEEPGKPEVCGTHNDKGWKNVKAPRCFCGTIASWGREGTKTKLCCAEHGRERGMVPIGYKECAHPGCKTIPHYAFEGDPAKYCGPHAEKGMINVHVKECAHPGCKTQPSFAFKGDPAEYCKTHAEKGMIDVVHKECAVDECDMRATHGREGGSAEYCAPHGKELGMDDVVHKRCVSCNYFIVLEAPYLCSDCNPSKRQKTREMKIKALLESTPDLNNPIHDTIIEGGCYKYRPDFRYDALTHRVVVEVDEDQHDAYNPDCERVRMNNIIEALGMRCVFIRYNPDTFRIDGKKVDVPEEKRHELLLKTVREYMKPSFDSKTATTDVVYLYYDGAEVREEMLM